MVYDCPIPYVGDRIHAAALYCSDGRIGAHTADFLTYGLGLPRYDRVCLPGGPACLAGHPEAALEEQGVIGELHFLVEAHGLQRVVLVAHQSCAFYSARLELEQPQLEQVQLEDLARAAAYVYQVIGVESIEAYFARITTGKVTFESVAV